LLLRSIIRPRRSITAAPGTAVQRDDDLGTIRLLFRLRMESHRGEIDFEQQSLERSPRGTTEHVANRNGDHDIRCGSRRLSHFVGIHVSVRHVHIVHTVLHYL